MGIEVTLSEEYVGPGRSAMVLKEDDTVKGRIYLDAGDGARNNLNFEYLPSNIWNSGLYIPGITNESVCYNNGMTWWNRQYWEHYELDSSWNSAKEFKFFPGRVVEWTDPLPDYMDGTFQWGRACRWNRVDRIPTQSNVEGCCKKGLKYCPWNLNNDFSTSDCDLVMRDFCLVKENLWGDSVCRDWFNAKLSRPDPGVDNILFEKASTDFLGKWGKFLWELGVGADRYRVIHDIILQLFCDKNPVNDLCACKNKLGHEKISQYLPNVPAPFECFSKECKGTHPRFLGEFGRNVQKSCSVLNCSIEVRNLTGANSSELVLFNDCWKREPGKVSVSQPKKYDLPSITPPRPWFSGILFFFSILLLVFLIHK